METCLFNRDDSFYEQVSRVAFYQTEKKWKRVRLQQRNIDKYDGDNGPRIYSFEQ